MSTEIELIDGVPSFTVTQFSEVLNGVLKLSFERGVWVEGEIEGLRKPSPHAYFSLVEKIEGAKCSANITIWAGQLRKLQEKMHNQGIELKDGLKVRLFGRPEYYGPFAKLSLIVTDVDIQFSAGDIAAQREELIKKLLASGVDKENKKKTVPLVPLRLGVISSGQAAGWADARQQLIESGIGFSILFCDVRVQGDDAPSQITQALKMFSRREDIDIVLLMRGGGSRGDLAAFDDERIARAIGQCSHPIFTGIGHEIDTSIADLMAHTSAKTPTACAEVVITLVREFLGELAYSATELRSRTQMALSRSRSRLSRNADRLRTRPQVALDRAKQKLTMHAGSLRLLDPATTMSRGWSITRDSRGQIIRSKNDVAVGDTVVTLLADGTITSTVEGVA